MTMKVAVEGCCHGELDAIYKHIGSLEQKHEYKVNLLLICGDFQAVRNHADLQCMAVPQKYRKLGGFYKYYLGEKKAPILTLVIGGNHEASNYMWELYHGGWLAPNIYFLGFSGCVQVNGIRIAGASGIYKFNHYNLGHYERVPYANSSIRSIYHTRLFDIFKLSHISPPDVFLSHDWPNTIEQHGDLHGLLRRKPFFRQETQTGSLGSPPLLDLLKKIKPQWWFSAHLHTRFEALYKHHGDTTQPRDNPDEIKIDDDDEDIEAEPSAEAQTQKATNPLEDQSIPRETRFLALDKCLPKRDFLEVVDIPTSSPSSESGTPRLTFDPEWLAITRALHPFFSVERDQVTLPKPDESRALIAAELEWIRQNIPDAGSKEVTEVQTFWRTAPGPSGDMKGKKPPSSWYTNPQTEALARLLQIPNKVNPVPAGMAPPMVQGTETNTTGESTVSEAGHALTTEHGEIPSPEVGVDVKEENNTAGGSGGGDASADGDALPVTFLEKPIASGGWSPSRAS